MRMAKYKINANAIYVYDTKKGKDEIYIGCIIWFTFEKVCFYI